MLIPFGKHEGQPVEAMTTQYLAWLITRDNVRHARWPLIKEVLRVLRDRLAKNMASVEGELIVSEEAALAWITKRAAEKKAARAEKLKLLEARRAEERQKLKDQTRAWVDARRNPQPPQAPRFQSPPVNPPAAEKAEKRLAWEKASAEERKALKTEIKARRTKRTPRPPPPKATIFKQPEQKPGRLVNVKTGWVLRTDDFSHLV